MRIEPSSAFTVIGRKNPYGSKSKAGGEATVENYLPIIHAILAERFATRAMAPGTLIVEEKFRRGAANQAFLVEAVTGVETLKSMSVEPVLARGRLPAGASHAGPAIVEEEGATTVVPPQWRFRVLDSGDLLMERGDA